MKKAQNTIFGLNLHIPPLCSVGAEAYWKGKASIQTNCMAVSFN